MSDTPSQDQPSQPQNVRTETRVDPAHTLKPATAAGEERVAAPLAITASGLAEGQAQQLAEWLQRERDTLEQRARMLDTQESDLEEKVLAAQAWLEEQRADIERREEELEGAPDSSAQAAVSEERLRALDERRQEAERREQELDQRQARLDTETQSLIQEKARYAERVEKLDERQIALVERESHLEKEQRKLQAELSEARAEVDEAAHRMAEAEARAEESAATAEDLTHRERALDMRKQEIDHALARYQRLGVTERKMADLQERAAKHAKHEQRLAQLESLLEEDRASLAEQRESLQRQDQAFKEQCARERSQLEADRSAQQAESKSESKRLARWEEEVERREEGLSKLKCELEAAQREVLEMRLATEETWAQLTGLLAPAALTRSISRVRAQLADYYSRAQQEIAESRGRLRDAAGQIEQEMQRLEQRRIGVEEWANRRHDELGVVAESLESREKELDRQQRMYEQMEARWAAERSDYREQIRLLLSEMREQDEPTLRLADAA